MKKVEEDIMPSTAFFSIDIFAVEKTPIVEEENNEKVVKWRRESRIDVLNIELFTQFGSR